MATELYGASLIICCYNSALRLPDTLKHIALQNVPDSIVWEVIIVNNNSTDNTETVAISEWHNYRLSIPFRVVNESRAGLSFARQKGVATAKFDLLLFCDDDNWLDENYIHYAFEIMRLNKNIGVLGGRSEGLFQTEKPEWFEKFQTAYAVGSPMLQSGVVNTRRYIAGAGMVVRKSLMQALEGLSYKQLLTGRKGSELSSGEDVELCLVLLFLGYDIYYDERLRFIHYIPANRLSWNYCVNMLSRGHAIPQIYFELYQYCHQKMSNGESPLFDDVYRAMQRKLFRKLIGVLVNTKPFWYSIKILIKSLPGSRREIELKSLINKSYYLIKNRQSLKEDFTWMTVFMDRLHKYKILLSKCSSAI